MYAPFLRESMHMWNRMDSTDNIKKRKEKQFTNVANWDLKSFSALNILQNFRIVNSYLGKKKLFTKVKFKLLVH